MILVFNVYLTTKPRYAGVAFQTEVDRYLARVRGAPSNFRTQTKLDICRYSLASLAVVPWTDAIINIELDDTYTPDEQAAVLDYARALFPGAAVGARRVSTRREWIELWEAIRAKHPQGWVYFCPNHDHVFMGNDPSIVGQYVDFARQVRDVTKNVTRVCVSHQLENLLALREGSPIRNMFLLGGEIVAEQPDFVVARRPFYAWDSYYIAHVDDLLAYFFGSLQEGYCPRGEDCYPYPFPNVGNLALIPKRKLCDHYDGYSHVFAHPVFLKRYGYRFIDRVSPLFIPPGFFENDIRVRYGYDDARQGWVGVSADRRRPPSFLSPDGVDLRCEFSQIPYFWLDRISATEIRDDHRAQARASGAPSNVEDDNPFHDFSSVLPPMNPRVLDPYQGFEYA
jgi:hypothetical protein